MALTDKQKEIITRGTKLRDNKGDNKSFIDIVEEKITGTTLTNFVDALKTEIVARNNARKTAIDADNTDINS